MFKNIIAPVQAWFLSQGRCVGCGTPLTEGKRSLQSGEEEEIVCKKCSRIFLFNRKTKQYRRAPFTEKI